MAPLLWLIQGHSLDASWSRGTHEPRLRARAEDTAGRGTHEPHLRARAEGHCR